MIDDLEFCLLLYLCIHHIHVSRISLRSSQPFALFIWCPLSFAVCFHMHIVSWTRVLLHLGSGFWYDLITIYIPLCLLFWSSLLDRLKLITPRIFWRVCTDSIYHTNTVSKNSWTVLIDVFSNKFPIILLGIILIVLRAGALINIHSPAWGKKKASHEEVTCVEVPLCMI